MVHSIHLHPGDVPTSLAHYPVLVLQTTGIEVSSFSIGFPSESYQLLVISMPYNIERQPACKAI